MKRILLRFAMMMKSTDDELIYYMVNNKTECALKIFDTTQNIKFPKYIEDSINE